jgi:DNA topoisomerase-1
LEKNKYINEFVYEKEKIQILNGPYWPYIKYAKKNYKIPKSWKDASDLTLDDCLALIGIKKEEKATTKKRATKKR